MESTTAVKTTTSVEATMKATAVESTAAETADGGRAIAAVQSGGIVLVQT
jgi:hypothetical protein